MPDHKEGEVAEILETEGTDLVEDVAERPSYAKHTPMASKVYVNISTKFRNQPNKLIKFKKSNLNMSSPLLKDGKKA
jgi:hypothetical protein